MKVKIVGAGLSGLTVARLLKDKGFDVEIYEKKDVIGGGCLDQVIDGKVVHTYGPHFFHTSNEEVWNFVNKYEKMKPIECYIKVSVDGIEYEFPINSTSIKTICKHLNIDASPILEKLTTLPRIITLQQLIELDKTLGEWIWNNNFVNYSQKMWDLPVDKIDTSIINRIKLLSTDEKNYFPWEKYVSVPEKSYEDLFKNMSKDIKINFNSDITEQVLSLSEDNVVVYTGSVDAILDYKYGKLPYRSMKFETKEETWEYETAVVNLPAHPTITRKNNFNIYYNKVNPTEKEFVVYEQPCHYDGTNLPLYPLSASEALYNKYATEIKEKCPNIYFAGRIGTYKYLDMDKIITQAFQVVQEISSKYQK
ncbi:MAG: NAD(P)-binding protein [Mycoplasmataceae bacterium]|nr:NAD(P)-binding protein [Mycoplasmataceae bacterium]